MGKLSNGGGLPETRGAAAAFATDALAIVDGELGGKGNPLDGRRGLHH
jgi:hypothetical protein